jgi:Transposase DDE domain
VFDKGIERMPGDEVWILGERRSSGEQKYYISNLPADVPLKTLAAAVKARWICEQAHQQLKEELGLDHFEGRSWAGLHRHALMTMIAYAFRRRDWKRQAKRMKVLSHKAAFRPTPDFSKVASPRKELRAFVDEMRGVAGSRLVFVAAQEEDLRAMERLSGVKAERFPDWSGATAERNREASLLVDFDAGFVVPGRKPLVVVTASDVLGSRAHHPQPMARAWNAAFDSRSSAAGTGLARRIAIGGNRRRVVARHDPARICGRRCRSGSTR